jgi:hypothetical protein
MNELFRPTGDDAVIGYQLAVYTGPEGEPASDRAFTLDTLYASVEDAIAHEQSARLTAELVYVREFGGEPPRLALAIEHVRRVVWL